MTRAVTRAVPRRPVGPDAWLLEVGGPEAAAVLAARIRDAGLPVTEVVAGARTVLLDGIAGLDPAALDALLEAPSKPPADRAGERRVVELPTSYDGEDLDDVAERWGTDRAGVVARIAGTTFTAAFCGFAPGFAYLAGLPAGLAVPRLDAPRRRVPAGSVGLADTWCAVYPAASPGGWRLLGRSEATLWDPTREQPALLAPGTRVRFVPA